MSQFLKCPFLFQIGDSLSKHGYLFVSKVSKSEDTTGPQQQKTSIIQLQLQAAHVFVAVKVQLKAQDFQLQRIPSVDLLELHLPTGRSLRAGHRGSTVWYLRFTQLKEKTDGGCVLEFVRSIHVSEIPSMDNIGALKGTLMKGTVEVLTFILWNYCQHRLSFRSTEKSMHGTWRWSMPAVPISKISTLNLLAFRERGNKFLRLSSETIRFRSK